MNKAQKVRRTLLAIVLVVGAGVFFAFNPGFLGQPATEPQPEQVTGDVVSTLETLEVKGRAPKTNYSREQFGGDWNTVNGCDTRNVILARDLTEVVINDRCQVVSGVLNDPYTGEVIRFQRGSDTSDDVQIDHVVALSDAWQKGAQLLSGERRVALANDPLELLAVKGSANQQKSDSDAASWLPSNKAFRCQYVSRQVAVKKKYELWVTAAEKEAILRVLGACPGQALPTE